MVDSSLLDKAVRACEERPGVPSFVDREKWPIQLLTVPSSSGVSFCGRRILIVCSTLGNWAPPVPLCIQENYVVVLVRNCAQGRHYGFRSCLYVHGESEIPEQAFGEFLNSPQKNVENYTKFRQML